MASGCLLGVGRQPTGLGLRHEQPGNAKEEALLMDKFGLRSAMLLVGVILMTGMLAACDDPDGAGGGDPAGQPVVPTD